MLVSIPPSLGGLDSPGDLPAKENSPDARPFAPFSQAMNQALAASADPLDTDASSAGKAVRPKSPSSARPPAQARAAEADLSEAAPARDYLVTRKGDPSPANAHSDSKQRREAGPSLGDTGVAQLLATTSLLMPALKPRETPATPNQVMTGARSGLEAPPRPTPEGLAKGAPSSTDPTAARDTRATAPQTPAIDQPKNNLLQPAEGATQIPGNTSETSEFSGTASAPQATVPAALEIGAKSGPNEPSNANHFPPNHGIEIAGIAGPNVAGQPVGATPVKDSLPTLGTSVAQQETPMKNAEKVQKTAEPVEQNLPGQSGAKPGQPVSAGPSADLAAASAAGTVNGAGPADMMVAAPGNVAPADDSRITSLERTHDLVAMHALRLSQSGSDSLRVVIEPGSGTRLSLELRFNNGSIQAQALLHRGDFQFLSSHWSELQQRLEPRGIHLGNLSCSDQSAGGHGRFQQSGHHSTEDQPTRSAFAEFALDGPMADSPAARRSRTKTKAGWETWA